MVILPIVYMGAVPSNIFLLFFLLFLFFFFLCVCVCVCVCAFFGSAFAAAALPVSHRAEPNKPEKSRILIEVLA